MKLFGLTGGVGMGKSTSARLLSARGVPVVDTDALARELVAPGEPALREIVAVFGPDVIDASGDLRRGALAELVFTDSSRREQLEAILHPRIRLRWRTQVETWKREQRPAAVVVIPLLFETSAQEDFDAIVCIACSAATQQSRLLARGWTSKQICQRMAAQWSVERKIAQSHHVVWTEGDLWIHELQLERIFAGYFTSRR